MPRTHAQRGFDAFATIFAAAHASPDGRALPDVVVDVLFDDETVHDTLACVGIVLPNGNQLNIDDDSGRTDQDNHNISCDLRPTA